MTPTTKIYVVYATHVDPTHDPFLEVTNDPVVAIEGEKIVAKQKHVAGYEMKVITPEVWATLPPFVAADEAKGHETALQATQALLGMLTAVQKPREDLAIDLAGIQPGEE